MSKHYIFFFNFFINACFFFFCYQVAGCTISEGRMNTDHELDKAKVVHSYDIEDLDSKVAYCRCWKSKKVCMSLFS